LYNFCLIKTTSSLQPFSGHILQIHQPSKQRERDIQGYEIYFSHRNSLILMTSACQNLNDLPQDLAVMMKNPGLTSGKDFLVVDVRDEDRVGGHIVGSVNRPSTEFLASVDKLVEDTQEVPLVIFHCALSQVR